MSCMMLSYRALDPRGSACMVTMRRNILYLEPVPRVFSRKNFVGTLSETCRRGPARTGRLDKVSDKVSDKDARPISSPFKKTMSVAAEMDLVSGREVTTEHILRDL